ncbi:hypothetical protein Tco_1262143 [Tanacetum coccineum]
MEISKADQIALDDALVAPANRLKIGKCNLRLSSDVTSKDATLQVVYDVLKLTPFYKAFQVSADVPEIYMQTKIMGKYNNKKVDYANHFVGRPFLIPRRNNVNWHYARMTQFHEINVISRNEDIQLYGTILPAELTNKDIRNSESYKEYYKPPHPQRKERAEDWKRKARRLKSFIDYSEAIFVQKLSTKIITREAVKRLPAPPRAHMPCGSGADDELVVSVGFPIQPNYDSDDDISWIVKFRLTMKYKNTHETLNFVNPDGQQQSSSVSSGFVSNMLNPNQDTGVDAIFGHNAEATSLVDIPVTAIAEPSFFAPTNHPPTPTPLFTQLQQPPILTPATTPSSSLQNLPNFGSLFGFDNRLKALEDNFSEFKQTNQYAEALSSIPGIIDQYLANKMKEAVDVAHRGSKRRRSEKNLNYHCPREKTTTTAGKTTTGSKTHKQSASQSAPVEETMQFTDVFEAPAHQEFETVSIMNNQQEYTVPAGSRGESSNLATQSGKKTRTLERSLMSLTRHNKFDFSAFVKKPTKFTTLTPEYKSTKSQLEKLDWINPEGRQYPHDLRKPLPLVLNSQGRHVDTRIITSSLNDS